MPDDLATILRLVAEGHLTPEEANDLIDLIGRPPDAGSPPRPGRPGAPGGPPRPPMPPPAGPWPRGPRLVRVRVTEGERQVVDLRVPLRFANLAAAHLPGLSAEYADRIRAAAREGLVGRILDVGDANGRVIVETE